MDDDQQKWSKQYAANFGAKEFLRFGGAFMTLLFRITEIDLQLTA